MTAGTGVNKATKLQIRLLARLRWLEVFGHPVQLKFGQTQSILASAMEAEASMQLVTGFIVFASFLVVSRLSALNFLLRLQLAMFVKHMTTHCICD